MFIIELIFLCLILVVVAEILMLFFIDPILGDIIEWRGQEYKVIDWGGFDCYDYILEDKNGQITKTYEWELTFAKIKGLGIQRIYRYFREVTGI